MKRIKKVTSLFLALCLVLCMGPGAVFADTPGVGNDEDSRVWITSAYNGASGVLTLSYEAQSALVQPDFFIGMLNFDSTKLALCSADGTVLSAEEDAIVSLQEAFTLSNPLNINDGSVYKDSAAKRSTLLLVGTSSSGKGLDLTSRRVVGTITLRVLDKSNGGKYTEQELKDGHFQGDTISFPTLKQMDQVTNSEGDGGYAGLLLSDGNEQRSAYYLPQDLFADFGTVVTDYPMGNKPVLGYPGSDNLPSLGGTVTITADKTPVVAGSKLTAATANTQETTGLAYTWKRGAEIINGATGSTYTAVSEDVGRQLSVEVGHEGYAPITSNSLTVIGAPGAPTNLKGVVSGSLKITYTWTAPEANGSAVDEYTLMLKDETDGSTITGNPFMFSGPAVKKEVSGLKENHVYSAALKAHNEAGYGAEAKASENVMAQNIINAAPPAIDGQPKSETKEYGDMLELKTAAHATDTENGNSTLSYQWYEAEKADGTGGTAIAGATEDTYTAKLTKAGTRYFYCIVTNTNDLSKVEEDIRGDQTTAETKSEIAVITITKKALAASGIMVKESASAYKNGTVDLSTLLTLSAAAGVVEGETVTQVLDLANARITDSAIVKFTTEKTVQITQEAINASGSAIVETVTTTKAVDVDYADVLKTNGKYAYSVTIPQEGSSTNYTLDAPITGKGTLTIMTKSSGGGGGGGGGGSSSGTTTTGTDIKKDIPSTGSVTISSGELKNAKSVEAKNSQIIVTMNQQAINTLDKTTGLIIRTEKKSGAAMNDAAKTLLGSRPVFDVTATQNGKAVTDFGNGKITISIAYTPESGEDTSKLFLYNISDKGGAEKVSGSKYDATLKAVTGQTNHLSLYAIGYDENAAATPTPAARSYTDVSSSDWFYGAVMSLTEQGVVSGVPNEDAKGNPIGTYRFNPQSNVTRAEFATMLAKAAGADLTQYSAKVFNDVDANDWYAGAVAWANSAGVASGTGDGNFSPAANITRQDMAVMVSKYLTNVAKTTLTAKNEKLTFTDGSQIAEYAKAAVEGMQTAGVLSGIPNEDAKGNPIGTYQYRPLANATRAEAAAMLNGLLKTL